MLRIPFASAQFINDFQAASWTCHARWNFLAPVIHRYRLVLSLSFSLISSGLSSNNFHSSSSATAVSSIFSLFRFLAVISFQSASEVLISSSAFPGSSGLGLALHQIFFRFHEHLHPFGLPYCGSASV
jgi:hypothetical protein